MGSLIGSENIFALLAVFTGGALFSALAEKTKIGRQISGVGIICFLAVIAAQLNIIPASSPLYDAIWVYFVPLAIAMFLIKADLVEIFSKGGRTLVAFAIGAVGAVLGTILALPIVDLGAEESKVAAVFTATYIGGSLNFAAVAEAVQFNNKSLLSAALAIDNVIGSAYLIPMIYLAKSQALKTAFRWREESAFTAGHIAVDNDGGVATLTDLFAALVLSASVCAAAQYVTALVGIPSYSMLAITLIMVVIATVGRKVLSRIKGEDIIAMALMYMFFAMIGAGVDIPSMFTAAPGMFIIVFSIFTVHLAVLFAAGYILRFNYAELIIASLACITGPPVAAAIAIMFGWRSLVVPGVLTGVLGYVIGNFIGVGVHLIYQ